MCELDVSIRCTYLLPTSYKSRFSTVCHLCSHLPQLGTVNTEHCFYGYIISAFVCRICSAFKKSSIGNKCIFFKLIETNPVHDNLQLFQFELWIILIVRMCVTLDATSFFLIWLMYNELLIPSYSAVLCYRLQTQISLYTQCKWILFSLWEIAISYHRNNNKNPISHHHKEFNLILHLNWSA